ncbi:MAG: isocitrate lyase/phosphoenolpyruvate mutase family protein [Cytophagales bacterium]|jgi:2-methylisocitrate lyase-like PEP mutase family enzyme|nr:isocitrate lyase/phosphoenolpyruvate mutase family protein [Cytophagales bacterium]
MKSFDDFLKLHQQSQPLLIGNIWDAKSAQVLEKVGYKAIGTSSAAVANSFGYEDGEQLPFELLIQLAKRVKQVTSLPLSVDIEGGFSRTAEGICQNIERLHDVGVVGINIEDSLPGNPRALQELDSFRKTLEEIANHLQRNNIKLFINVRTDGFIQGLPNALSETIQRIQEYQDTGVHGVFVPCIINPGDIREVVASTDLPVNVMCMPQLPVFAELQKLGVKRISSGNFVHQYLLKTLEEAMITIQNDQSFKNLF